MFGVVLVGDVEDYGNLLQLMFNEMELLEYFDILILFLCDGVEKFLMGVDKLLDIV